MFFNSLTMFNQISPLNLAYGSFLLILVRFSQISPSILVEFFQFSWNLIWLFSVLLFQVIFVPCRSISVKFSFLIIYVFLSGFLFGVSLYHFDLFWMILVVFGNFLSIFVVFRCFWSFLITTTSLQGTIYAPWPCSAR